MAFLLIVSIKAVAMALSLKKNSEQSKKVWAILDYPVSQIGKEGLFDEKT